MNKINELFEKAKKGKLDLKELEQYEIEQEIKDLDEFLNSNQGIWLFFIYSLVVITNCIKAFK